MLAQDALKKINDLFEMYQYELHQEIDNVRIYTYRLGLYPGAEIVPISSTVTPETLETIKVEYTKSGFNTKIYKWKNIECLEDYLFKGFFNVELENERNNKRYTEYTEKIISPYRAECNKINDKLQYKYIPINFKKETDFTVESENRSLIESIIHQINNAGPQLVIVEAPAGYGKTSTAYEVLKRLSSEKDIRPFFMELARNRNLTTFKDLLFHQVDDNFASNLKYNVIIHNIKNGKIPLIIDGFDELLSRDMDNGAMDARFEDVETMLSTIADLLRDECKIVLTSRKTAIFGSSTFKTWTEQLARKDIIFTVTRYDLYEPSINDWLDESQKKNLPNELENLNHPVLLNYLKYTTSQNLKDLLNAEILMDKYFQFLLNRERTRQELPFTVDEQKKIFSNVAAYFAAFDVTSIARKDISDVIYENDAVLIENEMHQESDFWEILNALTNHALLDRRENGSVGFLNELIFGYLLCWYLLNNNSNSEFTKAFSSNTITRIIEVGRLMTASTKNSLFELIRSSTEPSPINKFWASIKLKSQTYFELKETSIDGGIIQKSIIGTKEGIINNCTFSNIKFINCTFNSKFIDNVQFVCCTFQNCTITEPNNCGFFLCNGNSVVPTELITEINEDPNIDWMISYLSKFFKHSGTTRPVRLDNLILENEDKKTQNKNIAQLVSRSFITIYGVQSYITKKGIEYLRNNKD